MTSKDNFAPFDFSFDPTLEDFSGFGGDGYPSMDDIPNADPGIFLPNDEGRTEFLPPDPSRMADLPQGVDRDSVEYAARPAEERTLELFNQMRPHRMVLLGIVDAARTPCSDERMAEVIEGLREHKFSVYAPSNLCTMLEVAGALERVTEAGEPYDQVEIAPDIVTVDGVDYYQPSNPPMVYWRATEAGLGQLEGDDAIERVRCLFDSESEFMPIYQRVLQLTQGGATMSDLSAAVDDNPLIAEPRRFFVQHFAEGLERCETIAWKGSAWGITPTGEAALAFLDEVLGSGAEAAQDEAAAAFGHAMPTETDGVSW